MPPLPRKNQTLLVRRGERPSTSMPWLHCRGTSILMSEDRAGLTSILNVCEVRGGRDVHSYHTFTRAARSCLAWLVLVLVAPVPGVMSVAIGDLSESRCDDFAPEDASPPENEMPQDDDVIPGTHLKRTCAPGRPDASSTLPPSPQAKFASPRLWGGRPGSLGFVSDGRSLRIRIRSLTC